VTVAFKNLRPESYHFWLNALSLIVSLCLGHTHPSSRVAETADELDSFILIQLTLLSNLIF